MMLPPGYCSRQGESFPPNPACKLHKSIYGLKQALRQWFNKLSAALLTEGFLQSQSDHSLFTRRADGSFIALLVYVDDMLIASDNGQAVKSLKLTLSKMF